MNQNFILYNFFFGVNYSINPLTAVSRSQLLGLQLFKGIKRRIRGITAV